MSVEKRTTRKRMEVVKRLLKISSTYSVTLCENCGESIFSQSSSIRSCLSSETFYVAAGSSTKYMCTCQAER